MEIKFEITFLKHSPNSFSNLWQFLSESTVIDSYKIMFIL